MVIRSSNSGFSATVTSLPAAIESRGLTLFAQVDHAAGAAEAGLELEDEVVVSFGNPRAGTPLMQAGRRIGIELPLRMLVWRDGDQVSLGCLDPHELAETYRLAGHETTLDQMAALLEALAAEASNAASSVA
jgi:uncharacterized protein (DUF302 family)